MIPYQFTAVLCDPLACSSFYFGEFALCSFDLCILAVHSHSIPSSFAAAADSRACASVRNVPKGSANAPTEAK